MPMTVKDLSPASVFGYFDEICHIPRGSGNTAAIADYCVRFAESHGLKNIRDEAGNVIIYKDGTSGYENSEPVILQGHLDMVCEKTEDCDKDMTREGVDAVTDGEYVYAEGTTLGSDDGIAVAYILSVLAADDIPHPPIEALLTADEETGMIGANALDGSLLKGRRLINIDSEEEGILTASCAGGIRAECEIPISYEDCAYDSFLKLSVSGLQGGHSGIDIDKHRRNGIKILGRLLDHVGRGNSIRICSLNGGGITNAIPKHAEAVIACGSGNAAKITAEAESFFRSIQPENRTCDPGLLISCAPCEEKEKASSCCDEESTRRIIFALMQAPDGIQALSPDIPGMVQTSMNMGIAYTDENGLVMKYLIRSNAASGKHETVVKLRSFAEYLGGSTALRSDYPAWEYRMVSPLRDIMVKTYSKVYGREPLVQSIHAGLECGILASKLSGADMISFGPTLEKVHTPDERMSAASAKRCYEYLLAVLRDLK